MSVLDRLDALEREQQCQGCERRCECPVCTAHPQLIAAVRTLRAEMLGAGHHWWALNKTKHGKAAVQERVDALITAAAPMLEEDA